MDKKERPDVSTLTRRLFLAAPVVPVASSTAPAGVIDEFLRLAFQIGHSLTATPSMSRMYLSGINWIDDKPPGVRLRWLYPLHAANITDYLGFPDSFQVERAELEEYPEFPDTIIMVGCEPRVRYPKTWWRPRLEMVGISPALFRPRGKTSVQAVTFLYMGSDSRCRIKGPSNCTLAEFPISNGQSAYFEAGDIHEVEFLSGDARAIQLSNDWHLDLYEERNLSWRAIAKIGARSPLLDSSIGTFQAVRSRMRGVGVLAAPDWTRIQEAAIAAAAVKKPSDEDAKKPPVLPAWDTWLLLQALRWELAVLSGFGFIDGPKWNNPLPTGDTVSNWLPESSNHLSVYRITVPNEKRPGLGVSNVVVVPRGRAADLRPPSGLGYKLPVVTSSEVVSSSDTSSDFDSRNKRLIFPGTATLIWEHTKDPWAMGVDVKETIGGSAIKGTPAVSNSWERVGARVRHGLDLAGHVPRFFEVSFPDCTLEAEAKTFDGWDRTSKPAPTGALKFALSHLPTPPPLACAGYDYGKKQVTIDRMVGAPDCFKSSDSSVKPLDYADWFPDEIVKQRPGAVHIMRRQRAPISEPINIDEVVTLAPNRWSLVLKGALPSGEFVGGQITSVGLTFVIAQIAANRKTIEVWTNETPQFQFNGDHSVMDSSCLPGSEPASTRIWPSKGPARVIEDSMSKSLWSDKPVWSTNTIDPLAKAFVFLEDTPLPTDGIDTLAYASRVVFTDFEGKPILGPLSNVVSVLRKSLPPPAPIPFSIELLGRDYYRRLLVNLSFPKDVDGVYSVAWAIGRKVQWQEGGAVAAPRNSFASNGVLGTLGAQRTHLGRLLYEALDIPEPHFSDIYVTLGVKRVDSLGQESMYSVEEVLIQAM